MFAKLSRLNKAILMVIALSVLLVLVVPSSLAAGVFREVGAKEFNPPNEGLATIPEAVIEEAVALATELFGDYQETGRDFVNQLLATYVEAKDKNFVVVFNPGGWGWNLLEASPGWYSIATGIQEKLDGLGYSSLWLNYQRTSNTTMGRLDELASMVSLHPTKAKDLTSQLEFLSNNIPGLNIIIAGESTGTLISGSVMNMLAGNGKVYSIQTGPPFWYKKPAPVRTLLLTSNGATPDSMSQGDIIAIALATVKEFLGLSRSDKNSVGFIKAPGHDYGWSYPNVASQISEFLEEHFGIGR